MPRISRRRAADIGAPNTTLSTTASIPPLGVYLVSLDVKQALIDNYGKRPEFPLTSASAPAGSVFDPPARQQRLKTVAFPFFLRATATGADIGALVPADGLPLKAGIQFDAVKSASVTVSSAESYAAPWSALGSRILSGGKLAIPVAGQTADPATTLAMLKAIAISPDGKPSNTVDVTVVSEVFYARSFDVTLHVDSSAAVAAGMGVHGTLPGASSVAATTAKNVAAAAVGASTPAASAPAASAPASAPTAIDAASAAAAQQAGLQDQALSRVPAAPGVTIGWSTQANGNIGLRRTYDRPIAIGYRGVRYRVDLASGNFVSVAPSPETALESQPKGFGQPVDAASTPAAK
ncbi:hypothetical protein MAFF211479_08650 [Ralstonia solanacearum]|nr:hypothetical protein MAFF211479_08650 [Ralstonia solanacearum]BCN03727.1 hypothetical protein RPSB_08640 [Ralstonia solanacearum]